MATHSSILAWRIPWTEEPGGLQSMELQRVRHELSVQALQKVSLFCAPKYKGSISVGSLMHSNMRVLGPRGRVTKVGWDDMQKINFMSALWSGPAFLRGRQETFDLLHLSSLSSLWSSMLKT